MLPLYPVTASPAWCWPASSSAHWPLVELAVGVGALAGGHRRDLAGHRGARDGVRRRQAGARPRPRPWPGSGSRSALVGLLAAFVLGGVVGLVLMLSGRARRGSHMAFGPVPAARGPGRAASGARPSGRPTWAPWGCEGGLGAPGCRQIRRRVGFRRGSCAPIPQVDAGPRGEGPNGGDAMQTWVETDGQGRQYLVRTGTGVVTAVVPVGGEPGPGGLVQPRRDLLRRTAWPARGHQVLRAPAGRDRRPPAPGRSARPSTRCGRSSGPCSGTGTTGSPATSPSPP